MVDTRVLTVRLAVRRPIVVALLGSAMLLIGVGQGSARADVTVVKGSAYGYSCGATALGNSCSPAGPTPTVALASNASNSPQAASAASARADAGPATVFSSGRIDVSTQGTLGPSGSVTSSATITNVNASGQENFTASGLASSCTASATGVSGSTSITGGSLVTDNGDSDSTNSIPDHAPVTVTLPASPAANTAYTGHLHIGNTTDTFRWVFNEQSVNADGSITVNAAHEYLLGPAAVGELIVGRAACGAATGPSGMFVDRTPPRATLSGPKSQKLGASVLVRVSCPSEPCRATAGGTVRVPSVGAAHAKLYKLKTVSAAIPKGVKATLRPTLSRAARAAIRRALLRGRRISVQLKVTAADEAGNKTTLARRIKLKR